MNKINPKKTEICLKCGQTRERHSFLSICWLPKYKLFDSYGESQRYINLKFQEERGIIRKLKIQYEFKLDHGKRKYTADFFYYDTIIKRQVVEDYKGKFESDDFKKRWKKMKKQHPKYYYKISNYPCGKM